MTLVPAAALVVNWPRMEPIFRAPGDEEPDEQRDERDSALDELRKLFEDARLYRKGRDAKNQKYDIRLESMLPVLDGKLPLLINADSLDAIQSAVMFSVEQKVQCIILGGYDAPQCADLLRKHNVPVIVSAVHRRPRRRSDDYDSPYTLAARLQKAGIKYCISGSSAIVDLERKKPALRSRLCRRPRPQQGRSAESDYALPRSDSRRRQTRRFTRIRQARDIVRQHGRHPRNHFERHPRLGPGSTG